MRTLWLTLLYLVPWGCNLDDGVGLPDGSADADAQTGEASQGDADAGDGQTDAAIDAGTDAETLAQAGPITLTDREVSVVTDRVCDFDGDDVNDNAIADLGEPHATLLATALSVTGGERSQWVLHMPWVADAATPDDPLLTLMSFSAVSGITCEETTAEGQYCAQIEYLDACGEPLSVSTEAELVDGELRATGWTVTFGTSQPLVLHGARIEGTVASGGAGAEVTLCGYASASELGDSRDPGEPDGLSELERFLAGGSAVGLPTVPGIVTDVDIDGDGLETFELDSDFRVVRCIDGDATIIEGDGCWRDERIADGFALTIRASFVSAVHRGRERDWDRRECGLVYERLDGCGTPTCFYRSRREICPHQKSVLDAVLECERALCLDECGDPPRGCRACAEAECGVELASCLEAPDCCPVPPETSVWDPA